MHGLPHKTLPVIGRKSRSPGPARPSYAPTGVPVLTVTDHGVITVASMEYEDKVRTSVTDTGRGIPPEQREHIFDTFQQMGYNQKLQRLRVGASAGMGLGLSICQSIVKLLHGKLWIDEQYTEGSRFIFELPKS